MRSGAVGDSSGPHASIAAVPSFSAIRAGARAANPTKVEIWITHVVATSPAARVAVASRHLCAALLACTRRWQDICRTLFQLRAVRLSAHGLGTQIPPSGPLGAEQTGAPHPPRLRLTTVFSGPAFCISLLSRPLDSLVACPTPRVSRHTCRRPYCKSVVVVAGNGIAFCECKAAPCWNRLGLGGGPTRPLWP
jgi:hypothetical protein